MIKKVLGGLVFVLLVLFALNTFSKPALAVCYTTNPDIALCPQPVPPPEPGGPDAVSANGPVSNSGVYDPVNSGYPYGSAMGSGLPTCANDGPNYGQCRITPYLDVGNSKQFQYSTTINLYGTLGDTINVDINNAGAGCQTGPVTGAYSINNGQVAGGPDYGNGNSSYSYGPPTHFELDNPNTGGVITNIGNTDGSNGCGKVLSFSYTFSGNQALLLTDKKGNAVVDQNGKRIFYVELYAVACAQSSCAKGENGFRIAVSSNSGDDYAGVSGGYQGFAFRAISVAQWHYWTSQIVFGVSATCNTVDNPVSVYEPIDVEDLDVVNNGVPYPYGDSNMELQLQSHPLYTGGGSWTTVKTIDPSSNSAVFFKNSSYSFDPQLKYRLLLKNFGTRNSVFVKFKSQLTSTATVFNPSPADCAANKFSCTATPEATDPTKVDVTLTNNASYSVGQGFQLRQKPDSQAWPTSGFSADFTAGESKSHTFTRTANAAESYTLYDDTGSGANAIPPIPLCSTNASPPPGSNLSVDCQNVTVHDIKGEKVTYDNNGTQSTATQTPAKLVITGGGVSSNGTETVYTWIKLDTSGNESPASQAYKTFSTFVQAWPTDVGYTITLQFVTNGDFSQADYSNSDASAAFGESSNTLSAVQTASLNQQCLVAQTCSANISPADVEPGQNTNYIFTITLANNSADPFPADGTNTGKYYANITTSGGAVLTSAASQQVNIPAGPGTVTITPSFSGYLRSSGSYSVTLTPINSTVNILPSACGGSNTPQTRPFFEYRLGDLFTGGGYEASSGTCNVTDANSYTSPVNSGDKNSGGVQGFAYYSRGRGYGAKSQFGVDSLGAVYGSLSSQYGFYSLADSGAGAVFADRTADRSRAPLGGYLDTNSTAHCVPDFYDVTKQGSPTTFTGGSLSGLSTNQYQTPGDVTINASTLPANSQITIYVNGNATITGDIKYPTTFDATNQANVPFLAIIAKGDIKLTGDVRRLDGLYIAQPVNSSSGGNFITCDNSTSCTHQLTINGAVIAQQVQLLRAFGTLGYQRNGGYSGIPTAPAEIMNYVPSMVIGSPNFNSILDPTLAGLYNLPPVF